MMIKFKKGDTVDRICNNYDKVHKGLKYTISSQSGADITLMEVTGTYAASGFKLFEPQIQQVPPVFEIGDKVLVLEDCGGGLKKGDTGKIIWRKSNGKSVCVTLDNRKYRSDSFESKYIAHVSKEAPDPIGDLVGLVIRRGGKHEYSIKSYNHKTYQFKIVSTTNTDILARYFYKEDIDRYFRENTWTKVSNSNEQLTTIPEGKIMTTVNQKYAKKTIADVRFVDGMDVSEMTIDDFLGCIRNRTQDITSTEDVLKATNSTAIKEINERLKDEITEITEVMDEIFTKDKGSK